MPCPAGAARGVFRVALAGDSRRIQMGKGNPMGRALQIVLWSALGSMALPGTAAHATPQVEADQAEASSVAWTDAVDADALAALRGGADQRNIANSNQLSGAVGDNSAANLVTGNNSIAGGSFANASGLPMVIQNSGNNVLIQNSTIVNVQLQ